MARRKRSVDLGSGIDYCARMTDPAFFAWFAGFFDGEGHVWIAKDSKGGVGLSIGNTNRDIIESIQRRWSLGSVEMIEHTQPGWNTTYVWRTRRWSDVRFIHSMIRPYLTFKSADFDLALRRIGEILARKSPHLERQEAVLELADNEPTLTRHEIAERLGLKYAYVVNVLLGERKRLVAGAADVFSRRAWRHRIDHSTKPIIRERTKHTRLL